MAPFVFHDREKWNAFLTEHAPRSGAFSQSWEWGIFQQDVGKTVERLAWGRTDAVQAIAQVVLSNLPLGRHYVSAPRGPVFASPHVDGQTLIHAMKEAGARWNALFTRMEPPVASAHFPKLSGAVLSHPIHPPDTLLTSLKHDTETLLGTFHHKTRYNIRLAERKGVKVEIGASVPFAQVWPVFLETAHRGAFRLHERVYYEAMLTALSGDGVSAPRAFLAVARYKGAVLAANLMIDFAGTRTYLHGASSNIERQVMAPFLLHWALIEDARTQGLSTYDWWGVSPAGAGENHAWAGVTRFKQGWGGERLTYPGTFDVPLQKIPYHLYALARAAARRLRV